MKTKGFVLILCLCFVALMGGMLWSALAAGELSHLIASSGGKQFKRKLLAQQRQADYRQQSVMQNNMRQLMNCPAEYAVWHNAPTSCEMIWLMPQLKDLPTAEGSLLVRITIQGEQP